MSEREWRCFHCDEVFTDKATAAEHFGHDELCEPACKIDAAEYRRMEDVHRQHLNETDEASRLYYAQQDANRRALVAEEQKGYDRGLADGRAQVAELEAGLRGLVVFYRLSGEDALEHFERVAEQFYRDTHYLRPGKDCRLHGDDVRQAKWDEWVDAKVAHARSLVADAAQPGEPA